MTLPPRLSMVASFVAQCDMLADIGTDHAYIPIHLIQNGRVKRAVASDVSVGPAKIAECNIRQYGLSDRIDVVVGNGLEKIEHADVIVIAGMGGKLICDIIDAGEILARNATLVLQPMTAVEEVRRYLHEKSFTIIQEGIAKEDKKLYNVMTVKNGRQIIDDDIYYYIGKKLIENQDEFLGQYILKKVNSFNTAIESMGGSDKDIQKKAEFITLKERFLEVYNDYCS